MPQPLPTTIAVADAIQQHRQLHEMTRDELSYAVSLFGHVLSPDDVAAIEECQRPATVDDLMAIAYVLGVSPSVLLSHIAIDRQDPTSPLATGVPADVEFPELKAWVEGRASLDVESRIAWWDEHVARLAVLVAHHEEQLQAARAEINDIGSAVGRAPDAVPVEVLHMQVHEGEFALSQAMVAQAMARRRLDLLHDESIEA